MRHRLLQYVRSARYCIVLVLAPASLAYAATGCPVPAGIAPPPPNAQASLTADRASLDNSGRAEAHGNVRLEKDDQALQAPTLSYDRNTGHAIAPDGLRYHRPGVNLRARQADVQINNETGVFKDAHIELTDNGGRGNARSVTSLGPGRYRLNGANYTTCAAATPAWQLTAKRINLDRDSGRGVARDAILRLFDVPVFYTPYINFPIDDKRHTGFLLPTIGSSSQSGLELATPYYINIAPNYDATITPRLMSDRGLQLAGEFRYLHPHSKGRLVGEYLPHDHADGGRDRSLLEFRHVGRLDEHVGLAADYTSVSDDQYFDDLGTNLSDNARSQLARQARLSYAATGARLSIFAQDFETLADRNNPSPRIRPYAQLPQVNASLLTPTHPWRLGLDAQAVDFVREDSVQGRRYEVRPRALWGVDHGGWFVQTQAAWRYTQYRLDQSLAGGSREPSRSIPSASVDAGLRFQRTLGNGFIQTLEPRAFYLYSGYENQDDLPVFDTGAPDLQYYRLFAHNRFVGTDRIGDANQVTLGLTSRLIDPASGRSVLKAAIGRAFGFRDLRVRLPQQTTLGYGNRNSDVVGNLVYRPTEHLHAGLSLQYDPGSSRVNRTAAGVGYSDQTGRQLDLGYRLYRDYRPEVAASPTGDFETLKQTNLRVQWPLLDRFTLIGRWNYSLEHSQSVETLAGLEYRPSCCWALRGAWRRYVSNERGDENTAIMLQIELTGLGRFGDDIASALQRDTVRVDSGINHLQFQ